MNVPQLSKKDQVESEGNRTNSKLTTKQKCSKEDLPLRAFIFFAMVDLHYDLDQN
jgi:hypothetical protein